MADTGYSEICKKYYKMNLQRYESLQAFFRVLISTVLQEICIDVFISSDIDGRKANDMIVYFCYTMQLADYYEPVKKAVEDMGGKWLGIGNQLDKMQLDALRQYSVVRKLVKFPVLTKRKREVFEQYCADLPNDKELILIFTLAWVDFILNGFVEYVKEKCQKKGQIVKTVLYLQDISAHYGRMLDVRYYKRIFDHIITFDPADAKKCGFVLYEGRPYSKLRIEDSSETVTSDVFFCGYAKNRLDKILKMYEVLTKQGLICDFYISGVPQDKQEHSDKIVYNQYISYRDSIQHVKNSKCILEITQKEQTGYSLRTLEAMLYEKKLISDNEHLREAVFYHEDNIMISGSGMPVDYKSFLEKPYLKTSGNDSYMKQLSCEKFLEFINSL